MIYRDIYLGMVVVRTSHAYFQKNEVLQGLVPEHLIFLPADLPGLYREKMKDVLSTRVFKLLGGLR